MRGLLFLAVRNFLFFLILTLFIFSILPISFLSKIEKVFYNLKYYLRNKGLWNFPVGVETKMYGDDTSHRTYMGRTYKVKDPGNLYTGKNNGIRYYITKDHILTIANFLGDDGFLDEESDGYTIYDNLRMECYFFWLYTGSRWETPESNCISNYKNKKNEYYDVIY